MTKSDSIADNYSVYPGEYKPLTFDAREIRDGLCKLHEGADRPLANIIECVDHYKILIAAPGHRKDDFVVTTSEDRLDVFAVKRKSNNNRHPVYHSHEFNYDYFEYSIVLPPDIDTVFGSAVYEAGILSICFQKTDKPVLNTYHQVVVY